MIEFGVDNFKKIQEFSGFKKAIGSKPLLVFNGSQWEADATYSKLQNLFIDFFRGDKITKIALKGMDHVISFNLIDGLIHIRSYTVTFKKSGTKVREYTLLRS